MKIFCSGSCRLLTTIGSGHSLVDPIHSMIDSFYGVNFLGKLHNVKQHIQFIKFIKGEKLPDNILKRFLTSYGEYNGSKNNIDDKDLDIKLENIRSQFDHCDYYLFEICSLKLYTIDSYQVQHELFPHREYPKKYETVIQTAKELDSDLYELLKLIPENKKVLFQINFTNGIESRLVIKDTILKFVLNHENCKLYDPTILFCDYPKELILYDETHFNKKGHLLSFMYIYNNFLNIN